MADPHIESPMDAWDKATVIAYRCGFTLAGPALLFSLWQPEPARLAILLAATLCAACLHIYLKNFRLVLQFGTWAALLLNAFGYPQLALGAAFFTLGGLAYKEYFCFRVFLLNGQPIFLAALWFALQLQWTLIAQILTLISATLFILLAIAKWKMPLHFDIGDKSKYQI